jgi:hypothetical protein
VENALQNHEMSAVLDIWLLALFVYFLAHIADIPTTPEGVVGCSVFVLWVLCVLGQLLYTVLSLALFCLSFVNLSQNDSGCLISGLLGFQTFDIVAIFPAAFHPVVLTDLNLVVLYWNLFLMATRVFYITRWQKNFDKRG